MESTAKARGPYAKTTRVREGILDASREVFAESGYHGATLREVAERAGISEGGLVHHFANKSELLAALLERHEAAAAERYAGVLPTGLEAILMMLKVVSEDSEKPGIVELHTILSGEASSVNHPAHQHYPHRYEQSRLFVSLAFQSLEREGEVASAMSAEDLAAAYIALSDGLQLQWLYDRDVIDVQAILLRFLQSVIPSFDATLVERMDAPA